MTRKDYIIISKVIDKEINKPIFRVSKLVESFCKEFEKDNPRFNADKFRKACNQRSMC
jgi:hypothetical protein